jgi:cobalt/nickel transport system permease protein
MCHESSWYQSPPLVVELLGLIYRFIFIIFAEVNVMFIAQRSRLGYSSYATSFRSLERRLKIATHRTSF